ncbi:MAG: hypothetical protein WCJ64_10070 [Rhodospirillaceae bacterium]
MDDINVQVRRVAGRLVHTCCTRAWLTVSVCFVLVGLLGVVASVRLGMDANLDHLLSEKEPWKQQQDLFDKAFPQFGDSLVVVIDGDDADAADDAARALANQLAGRTDLFSEVARPDADPFFRKEGLLFLPVDEVSAMAAQVIEAQPFIGSLAADPSLRGLFGTLNLALEGVSRGAAPFSRLEKPLAAVTETMESVLNGQGRPLGWLTSHGVV